MEMALIWRPPTGLRFVSERGCVSCANFVHQSQGAATTIAPNRPGAVIKAYASTAVGWEDGFGGKRSPSNHRKNWSRLPERGVLDPELYPTGARVNCRIHPNRPILCRHHCPSERTRGRIGIEVGDITFTDIDAVLPPSPSLKAKMYWGSLVAQSTLDHVSGINIFVDEILTGEPDFPSIPGVAASVPNPLPPRYSGQRCRHRIKGHSQSPRIEILIHRLGQTLCHELGHALGLFHTSEYDEVSHDIYDDTPERQRAADTRTAQEISSPAAKERALCQSGHSPSRIRRS